MRVSWEDATAYCDWVSKQTGQKYSLPTEAQWEYAAGGGSSHQKWAGTNSESSFGSYAWYFDNAGVKTHQVGTKSPNALGLYDMSGNVWEWCSDWYGRYSRRSQTNPTGPTSGSHRVLRGGSWNIYAEFCRSTYRSDNDPTISGSHYGFRVVRLP